MIQCVHNGVMDMQEKEHTSTHSYPCFNYKYFDIYIAIIVNTLKIATVNSVVFELYGTVFGLNARPSIGYNGIQ